MQRFLIGAGLLLLAAALAGCYSAAEYRAAYLGGDGGQTGGAESAAVSTGAAEVEPLYLTSSHEGWGQYACGDCHEVPVEGHEAFVGGHDPLVEGPEPAANTACCASCHGGNGACTPAAYGDTDEEHRETAACTLCHEQSHGFTRKEACVACHYAAEGAVTCGSEELSASTGG
jgi:hypothetical protein